MTPATLETIERVRQLSHAERADLAAWLERYRVETSSRAREASNTPKTPIVRPDFAADLRESWGDAPPMAENAVLALRAEKRCR